MPYTKDQMKLIKRIATIYPKRDFVITMLGGGAAMSLTRKGLLKRITSGRGGRGSYTVTDKGVDEMQRLNLIVR